MQKKQPAPAPKDFSRPVDSDDPICPFYDRENRACASPTCPRLNCPCKFKDKVEVPAYTTL